MVERSAQARGSPKPTPIRVRFGAFELDEANASLRRGGTALALGPTPFAVLCALARQPGSLLTKNALLDEVWGHQFVSDSVLKTAISDVRTALEDDARRPRFIETVSRRGYRFIAATDSILALPSAAARVSAVTSSHSTSFVGRAQALARLRSAWDLACSGKRMIVWVAGEPGIGKTTVIDHFTSGLGDVVCARGQCVEHFGTGEPYLPILEAIGELGRQDQELSSLLRSAAPTLLLQLPWLSTAEEREGLRRELAGVTPERMLREIREVLDRYTERVPVLLVTEDLHWSDRATIQLIDYIARARGNARLMWLASFRLTEVVSHDHPLNRLRHELRAQRLCEEIVLDPFSETEIAEYLRERSQRLAADEALVRTLHARTDGVPLFVASVVDDLVADSTASGEEETAAARLARTAIPENLTSIIDHYIAQLDNSERALLVAAAVCGVDFRVDTVAEALARDAASVAEMCADLARKQLWLVDDRSSERGDANEPYSFRHALFRQVLYERTTPSARARLHAKVGRALERERAAGAKVAPSELALHFERGHEPLLALRYYAQAAEAALMHFSPVECMDLTKRALVLLDQIRESPERDAAEIAIETLYGLAATRVLGAGNEAKVALQRAYLLLRDVPQHPMQGPLLHGFGFMLTLRAEYDEALAVADRAEALGLATNDPVLVSTACTVHGQVDQLQGRWRDARTWLDRGFALCEQVDVAGDQFLVDPQVAMLGMLAIPLVQLGAIKQAQASLQRARARACDRGWPMSRLLALWYSALFAVRLGNASEVAVVADEMGALVDEFALAHGRAGCRWFRGWADARMGSPRDAYLSIRQAYEENARLGMVVGGSETLGYAAEALALASDWDGAEKELQHAFELAKSRGERVYLPQLLLTHAAIARGRGQFASAHALSREAIVEARAQEAKWDELLALIDMCKHDRPAAEDRQRLGALVDQMTEAMDTSAVATATELLRTT